MSSDSTAVKNDGNAFLAEEEEMKIEWQGTLKESEDNESSALFVATDNRLVFSLGSGHYKDIGFQHIESVEIGTDTKTETDGQDPDEVIGMGVISAIFGAVLLFLGDFSGLSILVGFSFIGLGGYGIYYGKTNYARLKENLEVTAYEVYHIILRTSATSPISVPIYIKTREDVGPDLSRLVQESK